MEDWWDRVHLWREYPKLAALLAFFIGAIGTWVFSDSDDPLVRPLAIIAGLLMAILSLLLHFT